MRIALSANLNNAFGNKKSVNPGKIIRFVDGNMSDQSRRCEVNAFQSSSLDALAGRCIGASHCECKLRALIVNVEILCYIPMRIGKALEEAGHHRMDDSAAFIFAKISGVISSINREQGLNQRQVVIVG